MSPHSTNHLLLKARALDSTTPLARRAYPSPRHPKHHYYKALSSHNNTREHPSTKNRGGVKSPKLLCNVHATPRMQKSRHKRFCDPGVQTKHMMILYASKSRTVTHLHVFAASTSDTCSPRQQTIGSTTVNASSDGTVAAATLSGPFGRSFFLTVRKRTVVAARRRAGQQQSTRRTGRVFFISIIFLFCAVVVLNFCAQTIDSTTERREKNTARDPPMVTRLPQTKNV